MPDRIPYSTSRATPDATQKAAKAERDRFYRGKRWKLTSKLFLARSPLCARCAIEGIDKEACHVHHTVERLTLPVSDWYRWDLLQSLCHSCHSRHHALKKQG